MKKCTYCGKQYSDEASVCPTDGNSLQDVVSSSPALSSSVNERQQIIDDEHIKLLAIFHFVVAGMALIAIGFLILHYLVMSHVFSNPDIWKAQRNAPPLPKDFLKFFVWFYVFAGFILGTTCLLNLISGIFLRQRKHRVFSMIVSGLNCLQIPFGTILGVFTIMVLSRNSVRGSYCPEHK